MVKFTREMLDTAEHKAAPFIMATADRNGKPNGVPMGVARFISDDEILIIDNLMQKTRRNLEENPWVAVSFWGKGKGYQMKGKARVETSGKDYDETKKWLAERGAPAHAKCKAVVIIKVEEIYYIGANVDSTIRVDQLTE
jgi:predicted pyridoxine 5'-phosphate oxidase superfamily flavin-nucleotide-binding protein